MWEEASHSMGAASALRTGCSSGAGLGDSLCPISSIETLFSLAMSTAASLFWRSCLISWMPLAISSIFCSLSGISFQKDDNRVYNETLKHLLTIGLRLTLFVSGRLSLGAKWNGCSQAWWMYNLNRAIPYHSQSVRTSRVSRPVRLIFRLEGSAVVEKPTFRDRHWSHYHSPC